LNLNQKKIMKKYFNLIDIIVITFSVICLIWICSFKIFWTEMNPLFVNAYKWADLVYSIFTSILAAGVFYITTIFIPKIKEINVMTSNVESFSKDIEKLSNHIVSNITNGDSYSKYSLEEFKTEMELNVESVMRDFIRFCEIAEKTNIVKDTINYQKNYIALISINYSNLLSIEIRNSLNEIINLSFNTLSYFHDNKKEIQYVQYFQLFHRILAIDRALRVFLNIENK